MFYNTSYVYFQGVNVLNQSNVSVVALIIAISAIFISTCNGNPSPNSLCEPGVVEEMPPHIRKVCMALKNSNNLSSALNAYIENEAQGENF